MSDYNNPNFDTRPTGAMRPEHHLHDSSEPLPGAAGTGPSADYNENNFGDTGTDQPRLGGQTQDSLGQYGSGMPETTTGRQDRPSQAGFNDQRQYDTSTRGTTASGTGGESAYSDRPLGVQPARQGGVAIGGRENEDIPMGKASVGDKMIGKTQKVMGKMTRNPEMHEKGELREAGGRGAAIGSTRAPHD